jgi:hypothetical protein
LAWVAVFFAAWWYLGFGVGPVLGTAGVFVILAAVGIVWRFRQSRL